MTDMKILYLGRNQETRISSQGHYLYEELCRRASVLPVWKITTDKTPHAEIDVRVHLAKTDFKPDVIYVGPPHIYWEAMQAFDIPKFYWWSDPHTNPIFKMEWVERNHIDVSLHAVMGDIENNRWGLIKHKPLLPPWHKAVLFPHSVNTDVFKDYGQEKDIDSLVLGRSARGWYPLRTRIRNWLQEPEQMKRWNVMVTRRPRRDYGWTPETADGTNGVYAWDAYAKLLNRCKTFPHDGGIMKYAATKMFETMACGTLALFEPPPPPEAYNFIPNLNFISLDRENYKDKIEYWIENHDGREARTIIRNAYKMVREKHSTKVRCDYLMELIEDELG